MSELVAQAQISNVTTLDPDELRVIEFTLPQECKIDHVWYPIRDTMRPGTAFLAKPWGSRTGKWRRRMYTRSNFAMNSGLKLETIINHTHTEKTDTSLWWQTDEVLSRQQSMEPIDIRLEWNDDRSELLIYENARRCHSTNLRLEPDEEWKSMRYLALAFSTGITPFLSYIRFMAHHGFGQSSNRNAASLTLIACARYPQQLIAHEELLRLQKEFPKHFQYHPVLTREWSPQWPYTTGRIFRTQGFLKDSDATDLIDIRPLQSLIPDLHQCHIRFCGNKVARDQLLSGLSQQGITPLSFRAEAW